MGKITQQAAQRIIDLYCQGASTDELADQFGLWQTSICNLIRGKTWKTCQRPDNIQELIQSRHIKGLFKEGTVCHIDAPPLSERQADILIGSLLGDGTLSRNSKNSAFSKSQSLPRLEYLSWMERELVPYGASIDPTYSDEKLIGGKSGAILERKKVEKHHNGYRFRTHQHPVFTELRHRWYKNGEKVVPNDLVLTPIRIAVWFFDDGSNNFDHRYATLHTQSFTLEEADFLREKLAAFDVATSLIKKTSTYTGREMPILKATSISYDNLIHLVKPYMFWSCFEHKIRWRPAIAHNDRENVKLTEQDVRNMFQMREDGFTNVEIAHKYGVHKNHVGYILTGRRWGHLGLAKG